MVRTGLLGVAVVLSLAFFVAIACGPADPGQEESRTMTLGHSADPGNPKALGAEEFAEIVAENTDGRLEIQVHGSEELGSDLEMMENAQAGTIDFTANSMGPLSTLVPEAAVIGLPFLFSSSEDAYPVLDGEIGDELVELAEEQNLMILAWWDNGIRHITNSVRPITEPEDLRGLSIRTPEDPMTVDIFEALGANPTPIDFGELYLALRQGTVDGQENPYANIWASDLHEVQTYLSVTGHKYEGTPLVVSPSTWESLSPEDQDVIRSAAEEARDFQREEWLRQEEETRSNLEAELEFNEANVDALSDATEPVYDKWREEHGGLVDRIREAAEEEQ